MTGFVMGLLVVQLMLGGYLLTYVGKAGMKHSNARATRLADPVILVHAGLAGVGTVLWLLHLVTDERGFAWGAFAVLLAGASLGSLMGAKTLLGSRRVDQPAGSAADVQVAEKQIPLVAIGTHGLIALTLVVCTGLVTFGAAG